MDEMEMYRNGVERRRGQRRLKNERRGLLPRRQPKFFDPIMVVILLILGFFAYLFSSK